MWIETKGESRRLLSGHACVDRPNVLLVSNRYLVNQFSDWFALISFLYLHWSPFVNVACCVYFQRVRISATCYLHSHHDRLCALVPFSSSFSLICLLLPCLLWLAFLSKAAICRSLRLSPQYPPFLMLAMLFSCFQIHSKASLLSLRCLSLLFLEI